MSAVHGIKEPSISEKIVAVICIIIAGFVAYPVPVSLGILLIAVLFWDIDVLMNIGIAGLSFCLFINVLTFTHERKINRYAKEYSSLDAPITGVLLGHDEAIPTVIDINTNNKERVKNER